MKQVQVISVSLESRYVQLLDRLAKKFGSKSGALRKVLDHYQRLETVREMETAYRDYFADRGAAASERVLTDEMMALASWPEDEGAQSRGSQTGAKRRRLRKRPS